MSVWLSDRVVAGALAPQTATNVARQMPAPDMAKPVEASFVFLLGDMAAETIDCRVYESAVSAGTYTALSGKQATQRAAHATNNGSKQVAVSVKSEEPPAGMQCSRGG